MKFNVVLTVLFLSVGAFGQVQKDENPCLKVARFVALTDAATISSEAGEKSIRLGDIVDMVAKNESKPGSLIVDVISQSKNSNQTEFILTTTYRINKNLVKKISKYSVILNNKNCSLESVDRLN